MISFKKIIIASFASLAVAAGIWVAIPAQAVCDSYVNVIACGTPTHQSLKDTYYGRGDIKALYNNYGINDSMINGTNMKSGTVYKDGTIVVDGQTVATGARTLQRNTRYPGASEGKVTVAGQSYYQFVTQNSFVYNQFSVFAWFDSYGKFIAAVIKDCGNPVWATATYQYKDIKVCELATNKIITIKENQFDGKKHSRDVNDCKQIKVCDLTTSGIITIKEKEFDSKKHSKDLTDCDKIEVCDKTTNKIVTIKEKEFDSKKHTKNVSECSDVEVCRISDKATVTIKVHEMNENYTKDFSKCAETPVTPPVTPPTPQPQVVELPKTGIESVVASVLGVGGLTAAGVAYVASRRYL